MKTIRELFEQLPPEYRELAVRNTTKFTLDNVRETSLSDAISAAFVWDVAPEGLMFWYDLAEFYSGQEKPRRATIEPFRHVATELPPLHGPVLVMLPDGSVREGSLQFLQFESADVSGWHLSGTDTSVPVTYWTNLPTIAPPMHLPAIPTKA